MAATNQFSIRSYSRQIRSHFHCYHQLVMPLQGSIDIQVGHFKGLVSLGDCVIIKAGQRHTFCADQAARFVVVDLENLPESCDSMRQQKFSIDSILLAFIELLDRQLSTRVNFEVEGAMFELFNKLLAQQSFSLKVDHRIEQVIDLIIQDLSYPFSNEYLAKHAYLSATQFKKLFKASTGQTAQQYISHLRMDKAKALLAHTDTPINVISQQVGYQTASAFSRQFKAHFGTSPRAFLR